MFSCLRRSDRRESDGMGHVFRHAVVLKRWDIKRQCVLVEDNAKNNKRSITERRTINRQYRTPRLVYSTNQLSAEDYGGEEKLISSLNGF